MFFSLPEKLLFYALIFSCLGYMGWQMRGYWVRWMTGKLIAKPASRTDWARNIWSYVLTQRKVRSGRKTSGAPMHLAIFYGFMTLLLATTLLGINTYSPVKFHKGVYYLVFEEVSDWMGLVFILGVLWALVRRFLMSRRPQNPVTTTANDYWTLGLLLILGVTGFLVEGARIAVDPKPWDWTDPIGGRFAAVLGDWHEAAWKVAAYKSIWWFHAALVGLFFCVIPKMRIRHIVMAVGSTAGKPDVPMGRLHPVTMEEVEQTEKVGANLPTDFNRWQLLSLDACMECGRCTEVCPAHNAGKVLNPKRVVLDVAHSLRSGEEMIAAVSEEALWACTTCNACVEACPVLIRHVDLIVDMRRNLVSEGRLSGSAATMLRQTASTSHAWGADGSSREDWMAGLEIPLCRDGVEFEWLFWVGCAGATDPGAVKTTKAVAQLLTKAGIRFACLGAEEACTGDPARRVGEEFLFQEKAAQNVSVFQKYKVRKVVTACPHCFNTLKNEYGDFEAELEVMHHTQLLGDLIDRGALLAAKPERGKVVLHDPCYLARVNEVVDSPRSLLGGSAVEPPHSGRKTLCCGAGGGRMWMEEPPAQRPSNRRADELVATGAETVAVACPFCRIMLGDSLRQSSVPEMGLVDLAELVLAANQAATEPVR